MPYGLTRTQYDALCIIQELIDTTGIAPSYQEIADELGYTNRGQVPKILRALKERGYIDYLPRRARSISLSRRVPYPPELVGEIGCVPGDGDIIDPREFQRFVARLRNLMKQNAAINHDQ